MKRNALLLMAHRYLPVSRPGQKVDEGLLGYAVRTRRGLALDVGDGEDLRTFDER